MQQYNRFSERIFIKQYGLPRSGTNAMKALIEINYPNVRVLTAFLGNKHDSTDWETIVSSSNSKDFEEYDLTKDDVTKIKQLIKAVELPIIIHIKKPIPWFESYFRYQKKKIQWNNPSANLSFDIDWCRKCARLWEEKVLSWLNLANQHPVNCIIVEHMEILVNPENVLNAIVSKFGLNISGNLISSIENVMKRGHYKEHGNDLINPYYKFDPSYHTENKWLDNYSPEVLSFAKQEVLKIVERHEIISKCSIDFIDSDPEA
jgi:hypothetical protein